VFKYQITDIKVMNSVLVKDLEEEKEVQKTYSLVLRFQNLAQRKEANHRVSDLEDKQSLLLYDTSTQKIARDLARENPNVSFPISKIQKSSRSSSNISFSAYNWLFAASKVSVDKEKKVADLFQFLLQNPQQAIEWVILGRSPYTEISLSKKWRVDYVYVINLLTSTRRKTNTYWKKNFTMSFKEKQLEFNSKLPKTTQFEVEQAIQDCYEVKVEEYAKLKKTTEKQYTFLDKLALVVKHKYVIAPYVTSWINLSQKARWKSLKQLSKQLAETIGQINEKLHSTIRLIVVFALFSKLWGTVSKLIDSTNPEEVVSSPFERKKANLPIKMLMKHEYDIIRPGNSQKMTQLAKEQGCFELGFPCKGKKRITGNLLFTEKIIEYLKNGASVRILQIKSGKAPNYKPKISVVLHGTPSMFVSTKLAQKYANSMNLTAANILGLDVNRVGKHMLSFSNEVPLDSRLRSLSNHYLSLTRKEIPRLSNSLKTKGKQKDSYGYIKTKGELNRIYNKRTNIIKEIKRIIPHYIAGVIIKSKCKFFCIEEFRKNPRGKRGALAKAIYNMPYEDNIFEKAVQIATHILSYKVKLVYVSARNTSKYHYSCRGVIQRDLKNYDYALCKKCGERVNTHINAAKNIAKKGETIIKQIKLPLDAAKGTG